MTDKTSESSNSTVFEGSKISDNSKLNKAEAGFDSRDLDDTVLAQLKQNSDRETQMIANFNAKVNSESHHQKVTQTESDDNPELGGPSGLEPTRYGDWERKGRCYDF